MTIDVAAFARLQLAKGVGPERDLEKTPLEVDTNCLDDEVKDEFDILHDKAHEEEKHSQPKAHLRQELDAHFEPGHN